MAELAQHPAWKVEEGLTVRKWLHPHTLQAVRCPHTGSLLCELSSDS